MEKTQNKKEEIPVPWTRGLKSNPWRFIKTDGQSKLISNTLTPVKFMIEEHLNKLS